MALAPLPWWREVLDGRDMTKAQKLQIADTLTREAERKGFVSRIESAIGRGAFLHKEQVYFNSGDKVLAPGEDGQLTEELGLEKIEANLAPGYPIELTSTDRGAEYCKELADSLANYRFVDPLDARAFIGWIVTSIVGGALPFRPMLWLSGNKESGKTFLLEQVLWNLLGELHAAFSDVSEAALISQVGGDSIPVVVDEAEPERKSTEDLVALVRLATSGRGQRARGTADGGSRSYQPRFSMLFLLDPAPALVFCGELTDLFHRFISAKRGGRSRRDLGIRAGSNTRGHNRKAMQGHPVAHHSERAGYRQRRRAAA